MLMKRNYSSAITVDEVEFSRPSAPAVYAPQLKRVVDALFAAQRCPEDKRAKVTAVLLRKQGACDCPACGERFDLQGYRLTRTHFGERHTLSCGGCKTNYVVNEAQIV